MIWFIEELNMKIKNNYNETLTNIGASIQKYFKLSPNHNTLPVLDNYLTKYHPKNVVLILLDGLGTNILNRSLPKNAFLRKNLKTSLATVFPATTAAATTSVRTGLNPVEHGYLGWTMYVEPIDKVMTLFLNTEKGNDEIICQDFLPIKERLLSPVFIPEQIKKANTGQAVELFPFGQDAYAGFDELMDRIKTKAQEQAPQYIYAYDEEPDATMHEKGPDSQQVQHLIQERNQKIESLTHDLHDTLLLVVADHGHIKTRTVYLDDYPEIVSLLERKTSIDQRAVVFKVKVGKKREFRQLFESRFGQYYNLYTADEIIRNKLFGDGLENPLYRSALGDFLAIATSDVAITANGDHYHLSHHAGYTDDEIQIPLIIKYCK